MNSTSSTGSSSSLSARHTTSSTRDRHDVVVHDVAVVTADEDDRILDSGTVVVDDGRIEAVRSSEPDDADLPAAERIDATGQVLMPGLVNAHLHADLSPLHGLFSDMTSTELMVETTDIFLNYPRERYRNLARAGYQLGTLNMIRGGITTFNAMDRDPRDAAEFVGESGLRAVLGSIISDYVLPESLGEQFDRAEAVLDSLHGAYDGRIRTSICPQGDLYCSSRTWRGTSRLAEEYPEARVHTHALETDYSNALARGAGGDDAISLFDRYDLSNDRLVAAHLLAGDEDDARRLAESGAHLLHCPTILSYYSPSDGAWPPTTAMREAGGNVALGLDDEVGSIEEGKRADLVTVDTSEPKFHPVNHLPALLTNTATASDVTNVVVDGRS